jgi:hypothetical protein
MWACTSGPLVATLLTFVAVYLAVRHAKGNLSLPWLILLILVGALAPAFHESGILASVLAATALAFFTRRNVSLMAMVLGPALAWGIVWVSLLPSFASYNAAPSGMFRAMGYAVRYLGFMLVPLQQATAGSDATLIGSIAGSAALVQTIVGSIIMMLLAVIFWRGRAMERFLVVWLLLSLAPFCFVELPDGWLELRYVYAAAPPFLLLAAITIQRWAKKSLYVIIPVTLVVAGSGFIVHTLEKQYDLESKSERNTSRLDSLKQTAH